ncbi:MAG: HDIG domain-containing protein [Tannerella sp.]|jgi:putative nucleotidyltransferase with HDIG domain|nr:HDIG domain-containing protein [Tannerella sp.]
MTTKKSTFVSALYILTAAFIIAFFFPREGSFRYQFNEGKPWKYDLLTAPGDFPVYKDAAEIEAAKDSLRKRFEPCFRFNSEDENSKLQNWRDRMPVLQQDGIPPAILTYIDQSLYDIYKKGIIPSADFELMNSENRTRITVLTNSVAEIKSLAGFHTVKSAYEEIVNNAPAHINREFLKKCNINEYLTGNIFYDPETSAKILDDLIQNIPLSSGIVQAGERIVDRGEVVDKHIYSVLRSLKIIHETKSGGSRRQNVILIGQSILIFGIMACFGLYMATFNPRIYFKRKNLVFILLCILGASILSAVCIKYSLFNLYIIPFAIIPIVIRTFFDSHTALFTHLVTVLICSLIALFPFEFLLLQILTCIVVIFSLKELSQRSQLIRCSLFVFLSYTVFYLTLVVFQEGDFSKINWEMILYFSINFILLMFSYVLIYVLEKIFGYLSPITLVELSNLNNPLLKKLSETAPGTFQHTLQVSILASKAGEKVGADTQLIRTGTLYHDIGKMNNPAFFTENQKGFNPHEQLPFEQSARIIISHVTDGIKMAGKARLPAAITDFIRTHHGKGKTKFFYNSFRNACPDEPVNESAFTYPGPNPFSKETAILMMADSVEAASRSLNSHTDENIKNLVDRIIDSQIADGLMKNAPLTFRDIETVKTVFLERLKTMYHTRVSYPDLENRDKPEGKAATADPHHNAE